MKISEVMTHDVARVAPEDAARQAAMLMEECDCGAIPVADGDRLVGMVTDRDIALRLVAKGLAADTPVRDVMSGGILYCYEDDDISDVAENMAEQQVRRLPVVNKDKRLVGIVSLGDISLQSEDDAGEALSGISRQTGDGSAARM